MKKIFLFIVTILLVFTFSACQEDTTITDAIDVLDGLVTENAGDITDLDTALATLQTELDTLQADVTALEGQTDAIDVLVDGILDDIDAINLAITALQTSVTTNADAITALNALVATIQTQITALNTITDVLVNPLPDVFAELTTEIVIAHTNDVHGRVNDDSYNKTIGMSTVKNIMDALDQRYENTFLIDAGDMLHGTTFATLEEGESVLNVMNMMGYDLMVPGNHDFNYGQDQLLALEALADFPMISSNIQYDSDDSDFLEPYVIQNFNGVKVGFFGLTSPETVYKTHPDNVIGLNFLDPITQATAMVAELTPLVDVIILVAHIGLDDSTLITTEDIALAVPGIDVIIDGHSHSTIKNGMMVGDTLIVSSGSYLNNLGVFSLTVQNGEIVAHNATLISYAKAAELNYGIDQPIQDYIDGIVDAQDLILAEVIGQTAVLLDGVRDNVRTGETNLGRIIADSMIAVSGADVSLTNGGGIRASIPVGQVTLGQVITVLPFGNIIVTKDLTGQQILDALEYGTSSYPSSSGKFPHVGGMTFEINLAAAAGSRVQNLLIGGVPVNLTATYSLATNDFTAAGGDGYVMFTTTPITGEFKGLHEGLMDMFTLGVDITIPAAGRIVVIPIP